MEIFVYDDYKAYLRDLIKAMPRGGHGQYRKLALHLEINSVVVSQILGGDRDFTPEQGLRIARYFGLEEKRAEYLVLLISKARAGTHDLKAWYEAKLKQLSDGAQAVKNRIVAHREISDADKAIFYSNWFYSAARLLSSIDGFNSIEAIAGALGVTRQRAREIVDFLVDRGLCAEEKGKITIGVASTHLAADSMYINNHRRNWRLKALERITEPGERDLFFSGLYSLSTADVVEIRREILDAIARVSKRVADSDSERVACLNIDWFGFEGAPKA